MYTPANLTRPPGHLAQVGGGARIARVRLTELLAPGGTAKCKELYAADGTNMDPIDSEEPIADPLYCAYGLVGEELTAVWCDDRSRWEPVGEFGLMRRGKLAGSLSVGGTANFTIWKVTSGTDATTGQTILVYDWLMLAGSDAIASGKKGVAKYFRDSRRWYLIEAECPDA